LLHLLNLLLVPGKTPDQGVAAMESEAVDGIREMKSTGTHQLKPPIPEPEMRAALETVTASDAFQRSPQLQRFLRFVVEETCAGRSDRLKEYVIGTEVFGRPADYDPRLDSLVRVEAHRLRTALEAYYQGEGHDDPIVIEVTKGSYVPSFRGRTRPASVPTPPVPAANLRRHAWIAIAATLVVVLLALALYRLDRPESSSLPPNPTIAVLPFDNLSADSDDQYFCFGLMDEITTALAKTGALKVVARTSSARFKRGDDIVTIGRQLRADVVLEGSVQKTSGHVKVTAQLINAADNLHIWSERYERSGTDLLRVQNEVAEAITLAVLPHLSGKNGLVPHRVQYSTEAEANQLYWKAAYFRSPMGKTGWRKDLATSADYLEQAVQKDPNFALAYAALADIYVSLGWERGGGSTTSDYMTRGRRAALRAVELDNTLAEAHGALGTVQFFYDYNRQAAEESFRRALQLDPSNGKARMWYAMALVMQRRTDEALAQARQAEELDPLSYVATTHLAVVHYFGRQNDEAIRLVRDLLKVADTAPAHGLLGMAYEVRQNYDAAIAEYQAGLRLVPNHSYIRGMLGHAYAKAGQVKEARALLQFANAGFEQGGLSNLKASYIYMGLGEQDRVFELLEKDYDERDPELPYINADPVFDPVRTHPRFVALIRKMGLPQ
jgi:TolB-like protein/Flp pilus assembly protein TadD